MARIFYFTAYTLYKPADMTILFIYMWKKVEKDQLTLDEGQQRIVTGFLRSARNGGVGLEGKEKERFNTIQLRLAELGNKFRYNYGARLTFNRGTFTFVGITDWFVLSFFLFLVHVSVFSKWIETTAPLYYYYFFFYRMWGWSRHTTAGCLYAQI